VLAERLDERLIKRICMARFWRILITIVVVAAVALWLVDTFWPNNAASFNSRGVAYEQNAEYDRAVEEFDQAIRFDPRLSLAFNNRGAAYADKAQYDRAIEDYDRAIRLDPKYAAAFSNRGNAYADKTRYDRAIEDYDQAIRLDPKYAATYYNRGNAYADKAQYDRPIEDYDQAIRLDPRDAAGFLNRGNAYREKTQYDRAIEDYDQAIRLEPKLALAFTSHGFAYFNIGQFAVAAENFEQNVAINAEQLPSPGSNNRPQSYGVLWLHLARARGNRDDSEELMGNAAKLDLDTWPGPVVALYLKRIDANDVIAAATSGDAKTQREQGCDASFYVGEDAMIRQDTAEATRLLRQAAETCLPNFVEYAAAVAELKRLEK
jgi:tetratricopeptide (TPR) repeat protein